VKSSLLPLPQFLTKPVLGDKNLQNIKLELLLLLQYRRCSNSLNIALFINYLLTPSLGA